MSTEAAVRTVQIVNRWTGAVIREAPATPDGRANLSGSSLSRANLSGSSLSRASLSGANLSGANLSGANLRDANLSDANLSGANLSRANLRDANLRGANLSGADLSDANLSDANLRGADLSDANLPDGARWERYLADTMPALLQVGGKSLDSFAGAWECHSWDNCPMAHAFDVHGLGEVPLLYRPRANEFVQYFDAQLIPWSAVEAAIAARDVAAAPDVQP